MKNYHASFNGRRKGAIGIMYRIEVHGLRAENEEEARTKLYETYEHISALRLEEIA